RSQSQSVSIAVTSVFRQSDGGRTSRGPRHKCDAALAALQLLELLLAAAGAADAVDRHAAVAAEAAQREAEGGKAEGEASSGGGLDDAVHLVLLRDSAGG